jgi:hypothetical protein
MTCNSATNREAVLTILALTVDKKKLVSRSTASSKIFHVVQRAMRGLEAEYDESSTCLRRCKLVLGDHHDQWSKIALE